MIKAKALTYVSREPINYYLPTSMNTNVCFPKSEDVVGIVTVNTMKESERTGFRELIFRLFAHKE